MRGFTLEEDLGDNLLGRTLTGSRLRINQQRVTTRDGDTEARSGTGPSSNSGTNRGNIVTTGSAPVKRTITTVNGARLLSGPRLAENGAVYRVAAVLAPPRSDVLRALDADPRGRFTVLLETLRLAGLYDKLQERQG